MAGKKTLLQLTQAEINDATNRPSMYSPLYQDTELILRVEKILKGTGRIHSASSFRIAVTQEMSRKEILQIAAQHGVLIY